MAVDFVRSLSEAFRVVDLALFEGFRDVFGCFRAENQILRLHFQLLFSLRGRLCQDMNSMFRAPNYVSREMTPGGPGKGSEPVILRQG